MKRPIKAPEKGQLTQYGAFAGKKSKANFPKIQETELRNAVSKKIFQGNSKNIFIRLRM